MSNDETTSPTMVGSVEDEEEDDETFLDDSILTISWHKEPVYAVDCHPQLCHTFLTASGDGTACLWKIQDGSQVQPYHTVEERGDSQSLAKFSPNGTLFATACLDGSVQVFNASNGSLISDLVVVIKLLGFGPCPMEIQQDEYAVLGMEDGNISVFRALEAPPTSLQVIPPSLLGQAIICMESAPFEDRIVASGATDGQILLVQPESGRILARPKPHNDSVESLDFSYQYRWLASGSTDATISVWDMERSIQRYRWQHEDHTLRLWDIRTTLL
ncbi:WD repeat-containing protein 1 [Galdieria sulphuraria]|nr:WD repeat-containing protein 1 [Galdieria sulphuraria]